MKIIYELLEKYFFKAEKFSGVITFPDIRIRGKPWGNAINIRIDWCAFSNTAQAKNDVGNATGLKLDITILKIILISAE